VKEMCDRKWTREVIRIQTDCGPVAIAAKVLGPIAVHFGVGSRAGRISITHVGTGRRIASTDLANVARQAGEALADANWECVTDSSIPESVKDKVRQILKRYDLLVRCDAPLHSANEALSAERRPPLEPVTMCDLNPEETNATRD
jgi:hypothetical protein